MNQTYENHYNSNYNKLKSWSHKNCTLHYFFHFFFSFCLSLSNWHTNSTRIITNIFSLCVYRQFHFKLSGFLQFCEGGSTFCVQPNELLKQLWKSRGLFYRNRLHMRLVPEFRALYRIQLEFKGDNGCKKIYGFEWIVPFHLFYHSGNDFSSSSLHNFTILYTLPWVENSSKWIISNGIICGTNSHTHLTGDH